MAWAFVTGQGANSGTTHWTAGAFGTTAAAFASTVGNGNFVVGHATWDTSAGSISSVDDDKSNAYTLGLRTDIAGDGQGHQLFYLWNITNAPKTITVHFSGTGGFQYVEIVEYSGIQTGSDPKDVQEGQAQTAPGTGADGAKSSTSGTATTADNDLVAGALMADQGAAATATAGTGFTTRDTGNDGGGKVVLTQEDKDGSTSGTAAKATWTMSTDTHVSSIMTAFKQAAGAADTLFAQAWM